MAASHRIQITLDEPTGQVRVRHYCVSNVGGVPVTTHEDVPLSPEGETSLAAYLSGLVDANREEMESRANRTAIAHVAAVAGKAKATKQLKFAGTITPQGEVK